MTYLHGLRVFASVRMYHWPICHVETKIAPEISQTMDWSIDWWKPPPTIRRRKKNRNNLSMTLWPAHAIGSDVCQSWINLAICDVAKCHHSSVNRMLLHSNKSCIQVAFCDDSDYLLLNIQPVHWTDNHQADVPRPGIYRLFHLMADKTDHSWSSPSAPANWKIQYIFLDLAIRKTGFFSKDAHVCTFPCTASNMQKKKKRETRTLFS